MRPPQRPRPTTGRKGGGQDKAAKAWGTRPVPGPVPAPPKRTASKKSSTSSAGPAAKPVGKGTGKAPVGSGRGASSNARALPARQVVSTGMAARLAERSAMRRHRIWVRVAIVLGALVVAGAAVWVLLFSPVLALDTDRVTISGEGTVIDVDEVAAIVDAQDGVPLPRLDTVGIRTQILELNGVRDVSLRRSWPRGLRVSMVSREPVAAIPVDGEFALVDEEAVDVARVGEPPGDLPVITIPWDSGGEPSRPLDSALGLLAALPPEVRAETAEVSAATQDDVQMVLRSGVTVLWGGSQDAALKVKVFLTLRALPENAAVTVYDVSSPTTPITR